MIDRDPVFIAPPDDSSRSEFPVYELFLPRFLNEIHGNKVSENLVLLDLLKKY